MPVEHRFQHEIQHVYDLLTDPQFLVDRCIALGGLSAEGEAEEVGEGLQVTTHRITNSDLPGLLKKLMGDEQAYTLTERWRATDDGWRGDMTVDIEGQPLEVSARFTLESTEDGCVYRLEPKAKANIPLIGKKVEAFILQQFNSDATTELAYTSDYLSAE